MKIRLPHFRWLIRRAVPGSRASELWLGMILLCTALGAGCTPLVESEANEQKNPHFLAGKKFRTEMDWDRAIAAFEDALATNPQNASAHWELGLLYEEPKGDFAAAIYHYQRHLKLRPDSHNASVAEQRINSCMMQLAKKVAGVLNPQFQAQLQGLTSQNDQLRLENSQLKAQVLQLSSAGGRPSGPSTPLPPRPVETNPVAGPRDPIPGGGLAPNTQFKDYKIKLGDTLGQIARTNGLGANWEILTKVNTNLTERKLTVGRVIKIPIR